MLGEALSQSTTEAAHGTGIRGLRLRHWAQGTALHGHLVGNDPCEESEHLWYNSDPGSISFWGPQRGETIIRTTFGSLHESPAELCVSLPPPPALVWGTLMLLSGEKAMADLIVGLLPAPVPSAEP